MGEVERRAGNSGAELQQFEESLLDRLEAVGLPTENVLVSIPQRVVVLNNLTTSLEALPTEDRGGSLYVSKMVAAAAAGLFDASLNYLWDETIGELRARVSGYDLRYFFDVAVPAPERRKHLSSADDLPQVADVDLLRAARDMGLISEVGHNQLDSVRYMRNHASAAHPNQNSITGLQLVTWLETCIRQVITLPLDNVTAETGQLLRNIKERRLTEAETAATAIFFENLPQDRADSLAAGLFGLYTDPVSTPDTKDNVRVLWPKLWPVVSEEVRFGFGTRIARFLANADHSQAASSRELFDLVDGSAFLPEPVRAAELDTAIDALLSAHHSWDNFATEPAPARQLAALAGERGEIPRGLSQKYVKAVVEVFLSNGNGITWAADPIYRGLIEKFDSRQAGLALRAFTDTNISSRLQTPIARKQWDALLDLLEPKLTSAIDRDLFKAIRNFSGTPDKLRSDSGIERLTKLPKNDRPTRRLKI
ncbi:hypothetical protein V1638_15380 [Pseudarthrobacter sp. J64]|uniref:hypothetical protein n=1 Tax=Pseudarthrobacter sp. J64 TaxID=3116485 RepID=UPI002E821B60|nr:hypothetical protein [Pseudarthrobacter sp. J64]MEE2570766.1 hypothetical protein [Pseudarthrobacter sp. J64]